MLLTGVASGAMRSGASLAAALAGYSGGVCSLEKGRGKRDGINPFIVGGMMGAVSSRSVSTTTMGGRSRVSLRSTRVRCSRNRSAPPLCARSSGTCSSRAPSKERRRAAAAAAVVDAAAAAVAAATDPIARAGRPVSNW